MVEAYVLHLSGRSLTQLVALSKARQRKLLELLEWIAAHPYHEGQDEVLDKLGRPVQHLREDCFLVAYWPDHAVRALIVTDVEVVLPRLHLAGTDGLVELPPGPADFPADAVLPFWEW